MPEAARERSASPPAGTALAPAFEMPPEGVLVGRDSIRKKSVTQSVTYVNIKVTRLVARQRIFADSAMGIGGTVRGAFVGLIAFLTVVPVTASAQDALIRACDLAAASSYDATRPADIPGVPFEKIDPKISLPACEAALAAAPENPRLLFEMGRAFAASKNDSQARAFFERSAAQRHAGAETSLGTFYLTGRGGLSKNEQEAVRFFKLAADQGDPNAQFSLGTFYEIGRGGLPKDDRKAEHFFKLAADRGDPNAQFNLAIFYETGRGGLPKSDKDAARLFKLAADNGSMQARARLGGSYATGGFSLPPDWVIAFQMHLRRYWNLPRGVDASSNLRVTLRVQLNPDGTLSQTPTVINGTASSAGAEFAKSAVKALELAQPFTMLKAENYNQWKELELVFDSTMFANAGGTQGPH
jgi:TPR repeat protein